MSTPLLQQYPSLSGYPTSFLKDLLSSPQLVEAYLFTLPQIQELAAEVERLSKENEDLAKGNMALRDELFALRDATAQSYAHAEALKAQWAEIEKAQASYYQKQRPSFLHLRLRHSITAVDDSSEKVANAFIEGRPTNGLSTPSMRTDSPAPGSESAGFSASSFSGGQGTNRSVEEFISEFKASRKTYHKRAIWAERWSRGEVAWRDD